MLSFKSILFAAVAFASIVFAVPTPEIGNSLKVAQCSPGGLYVNHGLVISLVYEVVELLKTLLYAICNMCSTT